MSLSCENVQYNYGTFHRQLEIKRFKLYRFVQVGNPQTLQIVHVTTYIFLKTTHDLVREKFHTTGCISHELLVANFMKCSKISIFLVV